MPIRLDPRDRRAWNTYTDVVAVSGVDTHGFPALTLLPFVLKTSLYYLNHNDRFHLAHTLRQIHSVVLSLRAARIPRHDR